MCLINSNLRINFKTLRLYLSIILLLLFSQSLSFSLNSTDFEVAYGEFQISSTGTLNVNSVGFEPDIIKFEITSTNSNFDTQTLYSGEKFGWGHGFANTQNTSNIEEVALTVASGSASTNGMAAASSNQYSIFQVLTPNDGDGITGWIEASVTSTNSNGFSVNVNRADDTQFVTYTAYKFEDSANIDVGYFNTSTTTGLDFVDVGFNPTFLQIITQPHRSIDTINTQVQDPDGDNGWGHGFATRKNGVINQLSMALSMHSENIDYHSWGSSDQDILYTLEMKPKTNSITGRIKASLDSTNSSGFTLDYSDVATGQIALYFAVESIYEAEVGYFQTPTTASSQTITTETNMEKISFIGSNTINSINSEVYVDRSHHSWGFGGGNSLNQRTIGYSSNSDSVNGHSSSSSNSHILDLIYTDQDGNVLGRDRASMTSVGTFDFELNWNNIVTSSTSGVLYNSALIGYYGFSSEPLFPPNITSLNISKSQLSVNESNIFNAIVNDLNGNSTIREVIATIINPNTVSTNISFIPKSINQTKNTGDLETGVQNYTAQSSGATLGEAGSITLQNRETKLINFTNSYNSTPVIIAIPATQNNDESAYSIAVHSINTTNANISLCRDNGATTCDTSYTAEEVHYMIFDVDVAATYSWIDVGRINVTTNGNTNSFTFSSTFSNTPYIFGLPQTYNINSIVTNGIAAHSWFPSVSTAGASIVGCDHPGTLNDCAGTATEEFGYVAIDTTNQNFSTFDSGTENIQNSDWTPISFIEPFSNPIISVMQNSENGPEDPAYPWARSVTTVGADIRYCEQEGANLCDTHAGEDVMWMIFEEGLIAIGNGGDDIEKNITLSTYDNIFLDDLVNITNVNVEVDVTSYDNSASINRSNNDVDLAIDFRTETGWEFVGNLGVTGVGTYTINVTNQSILSNWEFVKNRDIRVRGVNFDYVDSSTKDTIEFDSVITASNFKQYTSNWTYNFTNTSILGEYNITQIFARDRDNLTTTLNYTNKSFQVVEDVLITLLTPNNETKIFPNRTINFSFRVDTSTTINNTCSIYLNAILEKTISCIRGDITSTLINLSESGSYEWFIEGSDDFGTITNTSSTFEFLSIFQNHKRISKQLSFDSSNMYLTQITLTNLDTQTSPSSTVFDYIQQSYSGGSYSPAFNTSSSIISNSGRNFEGDLLSWNISSLSANSSVNVSYLLATSQNSSSSLLDQFVVGFE